MTHAFAGALPGLARGRLRQRGSRPEPGGRRRLALPSPLRTGRDYDAVGLAERDGRRVMELLPRAGCVLAHGGRWWWIVPPQSDVGVEWPPIALYAVGGMVSGGSEGRAGGADEEPRLVHAPDDREPYTHPLLLHIAVCAVAGVAPAWPREERRP
ncbi:hypothetical protein [Streptomyces coffeae]|uniref:Uncharacterized protein n=1 Tax=Streptomyces coffeae TaxID=621382 RepID=A0ABS1N6E6_9ACTN|nr:hypothetical protein [Streptomyces coffeae]MBL1095603.1 hypothetical protein [Streptomyces coffeae]